MGLLLTRQPSTAIAALVLLLCHAVKRAEGYSYHLVWYPNAEYYEFQPGDDPAQLNYDDSSFWNCGSGAFISWDDDGTPRCETSGDADESMIGENGCQTVSDYGARTTDTLLWWHDGEDVDEDTVPVLYVFPSPFCTGAPYIQYYPGDDYVPVDSDGNPPEEGLYFESYYIHAGPKQTDDLDPGIGVKLTFHPYYNMEPYDQNNCVEPDDYDYDDGLVDGKFIYTPFIDSDGNPPADWESYSCVSSDDRVFSLDQSDNSIAVFALVNHADENGFGCVDFAGCTVCSLGDDDLCQESGCAEVYGSDSVDYCIGSSITELDAFPLGSLFFNLAFIHGVASDTANNDICEAGTDTQEKWDGWCIEARVYDCFSIDCGDNSCPEDLDAPFVQTSISIETLCENPDGTCTNTGYDDAGGDSDVACASGDDGFVDQDGQPIDQWPLRATCLAMIARPCDDIGQPLA